MSVARLSFKRGQLVTFARGTGYARVGLLITRTPRNVNYVAVEELGGAQYVAKKTDLAPACISFAGVVSVE